MWSETLWLWLAILPLVIGNTFSSCETSRPNIVVIIADDLGWNDVSFHGSDQIQTPNIDMLAYSGVAMGRYYSHSICTPSRSAFLTGKYSHTLGMQALPLGASEDRGIPTSIKLLPSYLKDGGYSTHLVGKWHVGNSRPEFLPTSRGFDSHFGHRAGFIDYYEYTNEDVMIIGNVTKGRCGLDLFRNKIAAWDVEGYITDVYTEEASSVIQNHDTSSPLFLMVAHNAPHANNKFAPLQAPSEVVREMRYIELTERRGYAGFATITYGDFKLITGKVNKDYSTYQGGELTGVISEPPCYEEALFESTVYRVFSHLGLGFDELDLSVRNNTTIQCGPPPNESCVPSAVKVCLYNIREDPCETTDISESYPELVAIMKDLLDKETTRVIPRVPAHKNPYDLKQFNYTWDTWIEEDSTNNLA